MVLTAVLDIAVAALAVYPELLDGRGPPSTKVCIADAIVAHARALGTARDRYRVAVQLARNSPLRATDDVPFCHHPSASPA